MTVENTDTPPAPGKFCVRHWSWLCQAGQGKCQASQNATAQRYQPHGPTIGVLAEVAAERERQDQKWGEQNHPDIDPRDRLAARIAAVRDLCTSVHMFPGETGPAGHRDGMETMANQVWALLDEDGQQ